MIGEKLSVVLIVKDEEKILAQALESVKGIADELVVVDTGSKDNTKQIAKDFGAKVFDLRLSPFNFAEARNFSFEKCTGDWILWIDADDVVLNADKIRALIDGTDKNLDGYWATYNYAYDDRGVCVARHLKERLLRNNGVFKWKGVLHESVVPTRQPNVVKTDVFAIDHKKDSAGFSRSSQRNYEIISNYVRSLGIEASDPRDLLSLANACLGLQRFSEALDWYGEFTERSGWNEEIYVALHRMAVCHRELGQYDMALEYEFRALSVDPTIRDAYIGLGDTYLRQQQWKKAEHWLVLAVQEHLLKEAIIHNPAEYAFNPFWFLGHVYSNMVAEGMGVEYVDKAIDCFSRCQKFMPDDKDVLMRLETLLEIKRTEKTAKDFLSTAAMVKVEDGEEKLKLLLSGAPTRILSHPSILKIRSQLYQKTETTGKDIAIFCGNCIEPWDPTSLATGIGGSEEAVIQMGKRLAALGWNVTVFNSVPETKVFDGVTYTPFWMYSQLDAYDIFISWRSPQMFDVLTPNAKKVYLWLHDVVPNGEFTPSRLAKIDKVMVLTKFHRSLFPAIPEEKIFYTGNGLDLAQFSTKFPRQKGKMVNTSAPDRGLKCFLEMWPKIKEQMPEAEFHWFYGWQTFDAHNGDNPERKAFKAKIRELLKQPGCFEHGRVGHQELADFMGTCEFWVYPTEFWEISCISAMKAQAAGCFPVVTDVGALSETVRSGVKLPYTDIYSNDEAQNEFIKTLATVDVGEIDPEIAKGFSWDLIADQWDAGFLS